MKLFAAVAAACLVGFVLLVTWDRDISYEGGVRIECASAFAGPDGGYVNTAPFSTEYTVVSGQDTIDEVGSLATEPATEAGVATERQLGASVARQLANECDLRRSQTLVWSQVVAVVFVLSTLGVVRTATGRSGRRREPSPPAAPTPPVSWP